MIETWEHKETKKRCRATPWWEAFDIEFDEKFFSDLGDDVKAMIGDRRIAKGTLVQVGWLVESEYGCWIGVNISSKESFNVIEIKQTEEKKP